MDIAGLADLLEEASISAARYMEEARHVRPL
jgi:hypothetical protein